MLGVVAGSQRNARHRYGSDSVDVNAVLRKFTSHKSGVLAFLRLDLKRRKGVTVVNGGQGELLEQVLTTCPLDT